MPDLNLVVANERPEDVGVVREFTLVERRHHTSRIRQGYSQSHRVTNREIAADPFVFDEPSFLGMDNHVHSEPALVEAALRSKLGQPIKRGRCQH